MNNHESSDIIKERISSAQKLINENEEAQELIKRKHKYWVKVQSYNDKVLIKEIQNLWNNRNRLNEGDTEKMTLLLLTYRLRGLDTQYFISGDGASDGDGQQLKCILV